MEYPDDEWKALYLIANELAAKIGRDGEVTIDSRSDFAGKLMNALWDLDGGCPEG